MSALDGIRIIQLPGDSTSFAGKLLADGTPEQLQARAIEHNAVHVEVKGAGDDEVRAALESIEGVSEVRPQTMDGGTRFVVINEYRQSQAAEVSHLPYPGHGSWRYLVGNRPRRGVEAHQLRELAVDCKVAGARTIAEHELLLRQVGLHGGQETAIAGVDDRCRCVIRAHHVEAINLAIGHKVFELLMGVLRQAHVHTEGQQGTRVVRIRLRVPAVMEHIFGAPLVRKIFYQVVNESQGRVFRQNRAACVHVLQAADNRRGITFGHGPGLSLEKERGQ